MRTALGPQLLSLLVALSFWALPVTSALAQGDAARAEARVHFGRGVDLFDEGRLVEALSEFEEAYRISPAPALLYNLAQIHAELGHAVEAADAYQRFLTESPSLDPELRVDAERAMRTQRARIGRVEVVVSVPGARIFLDDVEVGASPLSEPVAVSAGEHLLMAQIAGFETQRHRFRVAGGARYRAELTLVPSGSRGASLRVESTVPGVEIRVDGASMGLTPLDATVPVSGGSHRVEGVREGYVPFALEVTAADGSEARVVVQTRPDPSAAASSRAPLRIALPATSTTVRIDGELSTGGDLEVPVGLHDLEIRAAEREPIDERIDVLPEEGLALTPAYVWTPDARASRVDAAEGQRSGGVAAIVAGGIVLAGGVATLLVDILVNLASLEERSADAAVCGDLLGGTAQCIVRLARRGTMETPDAFLSRYSSDQTTYYAVLGVGIGLTALGAASLVGGLALLGTAPSEADIDRGARSDFTLELDLGPGRLGVHGTF